MCRAGRAQASSASRPIDLARRDIDALDAVLIADGLIHQRQSTFLRSSTACMHACGVWHGGGKLPAVVADIAISPNPHGAHGADSITWTLWTLSALADSKRALRRFDNVNARVGRPQGAQGDVGSEYAADAQSRLHRFTPPAPTTPHECCEASSQGSAGDSVGASARRSFWALESFWNDARMRSRARLALSIVKELAL